MHLKIHIFLPDSKIDKSLSDFFGGSQFFSRLDDFKRSHSHDIGSNIIFGENIYYNNRLVNNDVDYYKSLNFNFYISATDLI